MLRGLHSLEELPRLVAAWGHEPLWDPVPEPEGRKASTDGQPLVVVGRTEEFPWYGVGGAGVERVTGALARRLARRGRIGGVLGIDPAGRRLTVAVAFADTPLLSLDLDDPDPTALACLARLAGSAGSSSLAYAARAADVLAGQAVGRRFFNEFRNTLERMAAGLPGPLRAEDRHGLALLQLTRVLFLYFVQAKGWLAGREQFLSEQVDRCLSRGRRVHRDLLRPLFFGTLNRPAGERSRTAAGLGAIPYLNGGLFEPHPIERRLRGDIPNELWRDAFDGLFERFHFTLAEGHGDGGVAPDMLGRVFEGVMAPAARRASGTYYTPASLVRGVLEAALVAAAAGRLGCTEPEAERRLLQGDETAVQVLDGFTLLDPAVGSGAFLLGALERLAATGAADGRAVAQRRRRVLQRNLFGVDLSAAAVRLTELRLWLAVIAHDRSERPEAVLPLPNLDCLIRQGDSLFDPVGSGLRLPGPSSESAAALTSLRHRVVTAAGSDKRAVLRELAEAEVRVTDESLAGAESGIRATIADALREGRGDDLFGQRRGLDQHVRRLLDEQRRELRAVRQARRTLRREREVPWFHYRSHFADVFAAGGFDLVVGNPPWLRAQELPPELRRRLAGRYRWWRSAGRGYANRPDLAIAFLERAVELTAPGGVVALLVPAKLATAGYGASARHALATGTTLVSVADLTRAPPAFDATVYPLALVLRKEFPPPGHRVRTALELGKGARVAQASLDGGGPWILQRDQLRRALDSLARDHPRFGDQFPCHLGLKTGANRIFLSPPEEIEPEVVRWAIRGRDLRAFSVDGGLRLLWTHGPDGAPRRRLPPRAAAYLAAHRAALERRADYQGGPPWTLFRTGPATAPYRVVWPDLARNIAAAALTAAGDEQRIPLNSCYVAAARNALEAERLAGWLNAVWLRAAAQAGAVPAAGGFARFNAATIAALPLPASVLSDTELAAAAIAGRRGEPVQETLDDIAARHLALAPSARAALRRLAVGRAAHRS
ncbi:MAG: Eco57I restriction-modification methylase domain-containing protein [Gemmatimonadales bacterium]